MKTCNTVAFLLATCFAVRLPAQPIPWDNNQLYERLELTGQQTSGIQDIVTREDKVVARRRRSSMSTRPSSKSCSSPPTRT